jgi:predicted transposase YdaD
VESVETARYGELINSGRILRFYIEELREVESLGISMLQLIIAPTTRAIKQGKQLIPRIRQELPLSQTTARTFRIDRDNLGL